MYFTKKIVDVEWMLMHKSIWVYKWTVYKQAFVFNMLWLEIVGGHVFPIVKPVLSLGSKVWLGGDSEKAAPAQAHPVLLTISNSFASNGVPIFIAMVPINTTLKLCQRYKSWEFSQDDVDTDGPQRDKQLSKFSLTLKYMPCFWLEGF